MVVQRKSAFAEESAEVEVLYANLEKLKGLTKKIQGSLNRLETSGKSVEEAIAPIYSNTQRLQITNRNIDNVIEVIDRFRKPLDQRDREDKVIRQDPRVVGIPDYVASIDRATRALAGLQASPLQTNQKAISELSALLRYGAKQLEQVFRDILREESAKIEPMQYMAKGKPFPTISDSNSNTLRQIHTHVSASVTQASQGNTAESPTIKAYTEIRGEYIANTLKTLAMAAVNTGRKMNADQIYQPGTNTLPMYADGLKQMAETEYNVVSPIFRREEWERVCASTMRQPIQEFGKTLRELNTQIQSNMMTDCFLAYEIVGVVQRLALDLERVFDVKQPILDALKPVRDTAKMSMSSLLSGIRDAASNLASLPQDGGAIPLTADVMTKLQTMVRLLEPVTSVLRDLGDGGWSRPVQTLDVQPNGEQLFVKYARDMIETLLNAEEQRARALLKSAAVQGVFMANNIAVITRMIESSDLFPLLSDLIPTFVETRRKQAAKRYLDEWQMVCRHLLDQQNTRAMRPPSGGASESAVVVKALSSKDKEAIKNKFAAFNKDFDELMAKHRSYNFEREARAMFSKEISALLEPMYRRFWERYHEIDKGKGKYVKYDKSQMAATLSTL
ncbi:uncharacterized protein PV09_00677 [Verruconis gallopava]|uniref:Exocyst complex protein EXO70 n=1 Tax=Verruconis gallopava TaxID=253628 RepID=A0A0D1Y0X6_9PEZI|nr:uncharacterized protein PV09_00677 [Verruconis gallopava]KIW08736.1 hypothetical protein PV09_00677 [Verruconis gallopava]